MTKREYNNQMSDTCKMSGFVQYSTSLISFFPLDMLHHFIAISSLFKHRDK